MKKHQYICTLLSDIVISSTSASSGFNPSLNYIPGSKFLGIIARDCYDENDENSTLDLFHNGKVRFGDAHPYVNKERCQKVPLSWFYPKGQSLTDQEIYLHHKMYLLDEETWAEKQPKQARTGYFNSSGDLINIHQDFSIKSAYDKEQLRAKDEQMYGYFALPKGTKWAFFVEDETDQYTELIKEKLEGKHRIGRSRSAEYGLVEIKFDQEISNEAKEEMLQGEILIYAASNLSFYDDFGRSASNPDIAHLNLPKNSTIIWKNSQIRSRTYQTWNRKRFNRDADRVIVEKGSVIAVELSEPVSKEIFQKGIGAHKAEGFGQVVINPPFLQSTTAELKGVQLNKVKKKDWVQSNLTTIVKEGKTDDLVLNFLKKKKETVQRVFDIDKMVNDFIKSHPTYRSISNSQWGMVRNYAKHSASSKALEDMLFMKDFGCLNRGQSEKDWRKEGRRDKLYNFLFNSEKMPEASIIPFTIKLASQMAKQKTEKQ
jgi:hypothetical protein